MSERILIVEDEAIVAADIEDCLESLGYDVCAKVDNGEDAISKAKELQPDAIMMDIKLKGELDGIDAANTIKQTSDTPVVYLTAHTDDSTLARAKVTEPYGYIIKPFEPVELKVTLELALHKHRSNGLPLPSSSTPISDNDDVLSILQTIAPFNELSAEGLELLYSGCILKECAPGDLVAFEGDQALDGFIVISGRMALLKTSTSGRELIVELLAPGDIYGMLAPLDRGAYEFTVRAQTPTRLLCVPKATFIRLLESYPKLYRSFLDAISARLTLAHDFSRSLAHDRVEIRIASALSQLVKRFCTPTEENSTRTLSITRQELADLTGTTVETAIRVTKAMEREAILDLSDTGVIRILELEKLEETAAS